MTRDDQPPYMIFSGLWLPRSLCGEWLSVQYAISRVCELVSVSGGRRRRRTRRRRRRRTGRPFSCRFLTDVYTCLHPVWQRLRTPSLRSRSQIAVSWPASATVHATVFQTALLQFKIVLVLVLNFALTILRPCLRPCFASSEAKQYMYMKTYIVEVELIKCSMSALLKMERLARLEHLVV